MTYQVLARRCRPQKLSDLVAQDHVSQGLHNALEHQKLPHCLLLCGPRGTGKTSCARIVAKILQCSQVKESAPCLTCENCLEAQENTHANIIEIDGASHNSVEHARSLIENAMYLPTTGEKKVYIIDEVHMLSQSAFNALLKTLEEPPSHVVFILATTEPQKIPITVLSRCQRYDFKLLSEDELTQFLQKIASQEKINLADDKSLPVIARKAQGSLRDALSLLEQVIHFGKNSEISLENLQEALGVLDEEYFLKLIDSITQGDLKNFQKKMQLWKQKNNDSESFARELLQNLYQRINSSPRDVQKTLLVLYESIAQESWWCIKSLEPQLSLELLLKKLTLENASAETSPEASQNHEELPLNTSELKKEIAPTQEKKKNEHAPLQLNREDIYKYLRQKAPHLYTNLAQGNIEIAPDGANKIDINLIFYQKNKIFYEYLCEDEHRETLQKHLEKLLEGKNREVELHYHLKNQEATVANYLDEEKHREKNRLAAKKQELQEHPLIQYAQELFNQSIDHVTLDEEKE